MLAEMTGACNVPMFRYIATNGAMPAQRARWMAAHFDLIGLSCDGPAEIQSQQRPLSTGKNSTSLLERAARLVHEAGKPLDVRVTLTAETIRRQPEIAEYICQQLHPHAIHVEVVYQGGRAQTSLEPAELGDFIDPFLQAQGIARGYGIAWETSGSRLAEIHGPYCNVLRNVINLVPGGAATACLKISRADQVRQMGLLVGENDSTGHFSLDATQIETQRRALSVETARCATCFNRFHCVRSCPDTCLLEDSQHISEYRCQLQRLLTTITLQAAAARLWSAPRQSGDIPLMVFRKLNLAR
jgi:sulfatase maturation enzyme AslB (radical SAM superfamily)